MPQVDELKRRARRAESDGELREALELYREALRAEWSGEDGEGPDPRLFLRIGDLHARLEEPGPALDGHLDACERYADQGLLTDAVAVCKKVFRLYPDEGGVGAGRLERAVETARSLLESHPDQDLCLRTARLLDRAGRTDEAVDLLRRVWEKRTGRRRPAGDIERLARGLDPDVDFSSWTPEWPPVGVDAGGPEEEDELVPGGAERGDGAADFARDVDDVGPERQLVRHYRREAPSPEGGEGGGGPRRLRPRAVSGGPSGGEPPGDGAQISGGGPEPPGGGAPDEPGRGEAAAPGETALRRGLAVLEDLLEVRPDDPGLRRRKVEYARRLGEPGLLEEALVELGDLLAGQGVYRGARLVYEEVLERLNPRSPPAAAGLRRVEAAAGGAPRIRAAGGTVAGAPEGPDAAAGEVDEDFRRRLSDALERVPRELARLQSAGLAATGPSPGRALPWHAHLELGRYLLLRDRPEEAAEHLTAARDRVPEETEAAADVLYHLAIAHRRGGRPDEARDCFRRLAELDPGFAAAWAAVSP